MCSLGIQIEEIKEGTNTWSGFLQMSYKPHLLADTESSLLTNYRRKPRYLTSCL